MVRMLPAATMIVVTKELGIHLVIGMTSYQLHDDYPA